MQREDLKNAIAVLRGTLGVLEDAAEPLPVMMSAADTLEHAPVELAGVPAFFARIRDRTQLDRCAVAVIVDCVERQGDARPAELAAALCSWRDWPRVFVAWDPHEVGPVERAAPRLNGAAPVSRRPRVIDRALGLAPNVGDRLYVSQHWGTNANNAVARLRDDARFRLEQEPYSRSPTGYRWVAVRCA